MRTKRKYYFINPEGKRVWTNNLAKFCRDHNLSYDSMQQLYYGNLTECRGWLSTNRKAKNKRLARIKVVVNMTTGERFKVDNHKRAQFCRNYKLMTNCFSKLLNGERLHYKNFMLADTFDLINQYS